MATDVFHDTNSDLGSQKQHKVKTRENDRLYFVT